MGYLLPATTLLEMLHKVFESIPVLMLGQVWPHLPRCGGDLMETLPGRQSGESERGRGEYM